MSLQKYRTEFLAIKDSTSGASRKTSSSCFILAGLPRDLALIGSTT
jgi:hypothetical protein